MDKLDLIPLLDCIDPAGCSYTDWVQVGMALKQEGYACAVWESWSARDSRRYHAGECAKKWESFGHSGGEAVTGGTIVHLAQQFGWTPKQGGEPLDWDSEIGDENQVIDPHWVEDKELVIPELWEPAKQLITYLETLFDADENVGYVTESWEKDGKFLPTKGSWNRTAGELIEALSHCDNDLGSVLGDYKPEAGAWIRFNPLDGQGCKNENVTEYRYALVESDNLPLARQNALIHELELPVAALTYSGGKSLHAIVRVDAGSYDEYRKRVDYLYDICKKNGLTLDQQNRNPSRLSRMPGVTRKGERQYLLETNIGKSSWNEWKDWVESINDDLPELEPLEELWLNMPELSPVLIDGVLRQGHKMLLAGPSKAGKSFALIELSIAIAEGRTWMGFDCAQGRVMYVNLELDRASCLHRFRDVYTALGWVPRGLRNLDIWNLRGKSLPMDKLAPKLIRRAAKQKYMAIIIDPIYKIITGDENSADQMGYFCNQFDRVCTELGCAVIYCHHHSKGAQGGKKSMDRASGSGVFARDPDAMLDLIELPLSDAIKKQQSDQAAARVCAKFLTDADLDDEVGQDDLCSRTAMLDACKRLLPQLMPRIEKDVDQAETAASQRTAWRLSGTLREFASFAPLNLWFEYPAHSVDRSGVLADIDPDAADGKNPWWQKNLAKKKTPEQKKKERTDSIQTAFEACQFGGEEVTLSALASYLGVTEKTVRSRLKEAGGFWIDEGKVGQKK